MTGFGKKSSTFQSKKVSIEVRSVNSKGLDLNLRVPSLYRELEPIIREHLQKSFDRGKVDLSISLDSTGESKSVTINRELAVSYYQELKEINNLIGQETTDYLTMILKMPDIFVNERESLSEEEKNWILDLLNASCLQLIEFRRQEGVILEKDLKDRIITIQKLLEDIEPYEQERMTIIRDRIQKGLAEIKTSNYDPFRLEQEMIFYIEKIDITEEKVRLKNHLDYFLKTMSLPLSGKKLGFISQEIGREINTLGSKCNHLEIQKLVVEMKDNLEKIKEQILNTL